MTMRRRDFITLLAGTAAWPMAARAQQAGKLPTIGYLYPGTPSTRPEWTAAFLQRLHELRWIEGRTVAIESRWADGRQERYAEIAAEFVRLKVEVIVTQATEPAFAVKQATSLIPIVFVGVGDPVGNKIVASLARPGSNITGLSMQNTDLAGKKLELLREVVPDFRRLAILRDVNTRAGVPVLDEVQAAARTLGVEAIAMEIRRTEDIGPAFDTLKGRAQALFIAGGPLVVINEARIRTLATGARLPTIYNTRESVDAGGLMSYGPRLLDLHRRSADLVDKILRGTKPADIPVEQPTKYDLVINLTTAKVLGVTVPPALLATADEIIE